MTSSTGFWVKDEDGDMVNLAIARGLKIGFSNRTHLMTVIAIWPDGSQTYTAIGTEHAEHAEQMVLRMTQAMNGDTVARMMQRFVEEFGNGA
jgi:hypothetical protein